MDVTFDVSSDKEHSRIHVDDSGDDDDVTCDSIEDTDTVYITRKKAKPGTRSEVLSLDVIGAVHCCALLCLSLCVSRMVDEMTCLRSFFSTLSRQEQKQWVLDYLYLNKSEAHNGSLTIAFNIGTQIVCQQAWLLTIGLPQSTFYKIRQLMTGGTRLLDPVASRSGTMATKTYCSIAWLTSFARRFGDKLPDTGKLQLPMCVTRKTVYEMMVEELKDEDTQFISYSHFMRLWRTHMKHIVIPKVSRFSKCDKCVLYKEKISQTRDKTERKELKDKRDKHLSKQKLQRQKYYDHILKAKQHPERYMSVILDGMDQNKTAIPHMPMSSKSVSQMWKLRVHLTGAIVHGKGVYGFFDYSQIKQDSNLTVNVILQVLSEMTRIPDVLYLQLDNCGRENKNKFVLGFLSLLVRLNIFRKIKLGFLMVGHTHEDIDRSFSSFSKKLSRTKAMTLTELQEAWRESQSMPAKSISLYNVYNTSSWMTPYLSKLEGHSRPHSFKLFKDEAGEVRLMWKKWATDNTWNNMTGETSILTGTPTSDPELALIQYNRLSLDKLQADLYKAERFFNEVQKQWWRDFLARRENG